MYLMNASFFYSPSIEPVPSKHPVNADLELGFWPDEIKIFSKKQLPWYNI